MGYTFAIPYSGRKIEQVKLVVLQNYYSMRQLEQSIK